MGTTVLNRRATTYRFRSLSAMLVASLVAACLTLAHPVQAQVPGAKPLPSQQYYLVFDQLHRGEFRAAQRQMSSASRGATVLVGGRFVDSVCYWTMLGESYYRLGEYALALEQFEAALELYLNLQEWPARTTIPEISEDQAAARRARVPWAVSARAPKYGAFNRRMLVRLGKTPQENEDAVRRGGVVDPERLQSVDIAETMRCVTLAAYRRHQIKGAISPLDPFTRTLTSRLIGNGGATVVGAWTGIPKAMALISQGETNRAATILQSSLQIGGLDHPLTPLALIGLGRIAADQNRPAEAQKMFMEASIAAAAFEQYDMVAESLHDAALLHAGERSMKPYQPLIAALEWTNKGDGRNKEMLASTLFTTAAMIAAESGDADTAKSLLQNAKKEMGRNDIRRSNIYTSWLYTSAMTSFVDGDRKGGFAQFDEFLNEAQRTSFWLFQLAAADNAVKEGAVTDRESEVLYDMLLREPTDADWKYRPEETMAFLCTPHYEPMERWFQVALGRKADEKAIGIAELIRRQRFFSANRLGGRLLSLRWVLNAPAEALSPNARKQKTELLKRYPEYKALSDEGEGIRKQLAQLPIAPDKDSDEFIKQRDLLKQLGQIVGQQEKTLRAITLIRDPCELAFPQPLTVPQIQQQLKPGQVIVSFLQAGQMYYVMKLSSDRYTIESKIEARDFEQKIRRLIKSINVGEKAAVHAPAVFQNDEWRKVARELSEMIFAKTEPQAIDNLEEIIFVPDGKAWYLPMEILQVGTPENSVNLNDKLRVRYAPIAALGVPDQRRSRRFRRAGIVASRNFLRDDKDRIAQGLKDMQIALPQIETIDKTTQGPSALIASNLDKLIVWELSSEKTKDPMSFSPLQFDAGKSGGDLKAWMMLPWYGVDQVVLSGVSSGVEGSRNADGSELFLLTTGLMASGTRTVLVSRWRVGGQSCLDLTRELALELGKQSASKAWERSVNLFADSELDQSAEPRIQDKVVDQALKASHPFFWAGYMLVDSGSEPIADEEPTESPASKESGQ